MTDQVRHQYIRYIGIYREALHSHKDYSKCWDVETLSRATITRLKKESTAVITHVKFVGIPTRDQARALKFYTEKLGFEVSTDQPFNDQQRWIELRIAHSQTRVVLFTPPGHEDRIGSLFNGSIACDDVEVHD